MQFESLLRWKQRWIFSFWTSTLLCLTPFAASAFNAALQGQSAGSSTWISGNLMGWRELDYIPCRAFFQGGPASNQLIVLQFDHTAGTIPGVQNLNRWTNSANVIITAGPTL